MDDNNFQSSLCITSMKQKLSGPTEAHGPFIIVSYSGIIFFKSSASSASSASSSSSSASTLGGGGGGGGGPI